MTTSEPIPHPVRLDDLIEAIKKNHSVALDQLTDAVRVADHLGDVAYRFTERARKAVVTAQEEARSRGNTQITVAHLVLGLVADPTALGARAIVAQGVPLDAVRQTAVATMPPAAESGSVPALIPFDAHAKKDLELSEKPCRCTQPRGHRAHPARAARTRRRHGRPRRPRRRQGRR